MTKDEIIALTLQQMGPDPGYEHVVIGELQKKLPEREIKTCADFRHLKIECCDSCHTAYPHYDMYLIALADGSLAWVCCPLQRLLSRGKR